MNDRQTRYVAARLRGANQANAAIEAGYSPPTARQAASRLEAVPEVAKALQDLKKPGKQAIAGAGGQTPLEFLIAAMNNPGLDDKLRLDAAKAAAPYVHAKTCETGKKAETLATAQSNHEGTSWEDLLPH
jgi:phage terminase small subunit